MNTFVRDLKQVWNRPDDMVTKLIIINVVFFLTMCVLLVLSSFTQLQLLFQEYIYNNITLPASLGEFLYKPWTLITYFFSHSFDDLFHIIFNMLVFYWFGRIFSEFLNGKKLLGLYILGGIAGGVAYLLAYNLLSSLPDNARLIGASASVYAIVVATAALVPDYRIHMLFIGSVKIKYVAAFYIFLSVLGTIGTNVGGNIAHLGGAIAGFIYTKLLQNGTDIGKPFTDLIDKIGAAFTKKPTIKVVHRKAKKTIYAETKASANKKTNVNFSSSSPKQEIIDSILDKISEVGYEKLTKEEKQILFEASKKDK